MTLLPHSHAHPEPSPGVAVPYVAVSLHCGCTIRVRFSADRAHVGQWKPCARDHCRVGDVVARAVAVARGGA